MRLSYATRLRVRRMACWLLGHDLDSSITTDGFLEYSCRRCHEARAFGEW